MASVRVIQTILGYIIPFALLIALLFMIEVTAELVAGLISQLVNDVLSTNLDPTPDFPGPMTILATAIGFFPSIWDIGTVTFYGMFAVVAYAFYIVFAIIGGLTTLQLFKMTSTAFLDIANDATGRAGMELPEGYIRPPFLDPDDDNGDDPPPPTTCTKTPGCNLSPGHAGRCRL